MAVTFEFAIHCKDKVAWRKAIVGGKKFFMTNWTEKRVQASIKRHLDDSFSTIDVNDVIQINNHASTILMEEQFTAIGNAIDDDGRVTTGRGTGGIGATVVVARGSRESRKRNDKKFNPTIVVSRASRILNSLNQDTSCVQVDKSKSKYCVCQVPDDGKIYIMCSSCQQWYHPKCINYNAVNDHAILKKKYECGYCAKSKSWPSRRPPVADITVAAAHVTSIRPT